MEHLQKAKDADALIMDAGDVLDVMQSRYDPRREHGAKLAEHEVPNYVDAVVEDTAEDYAPFAPNWVLMGRGNHETAVQKQLGTDLTERLVHHMRLSSPEQTHVSSGGYSGWVRLMWRVHGAGYSKLIHYYHGSGGNAPVTRGAIKTQRLSRAHPDPDLIWTGHTHTAGIVPWERWRMSEAHKPHKDIQWHVVTPGYKDDMGDGYSGFGVERLGNEPRAQGAAWVRFIMRSKGHKEKRVRGVELKVDLDISAS